MTKRQPLEKRKHIYSIIPSHSDGDRRIYPVKIMGDDQRNFSVSISGSQNARQGVEADIEEWCEMNFNRLKNGETIMVNLDEVQKKRTLLRGS